MENSIVTRAPHLIKEWHSTKNTQTPYEISYSSNQKFWWQCSFGHEWLAIVGNRYKGTKCPYCSGRKLSSENNFAVKCPHLIKEWHPTKNGDLTPNKVSARGKAKIWWLCAHNHEWQATTGNRYMGTKCPVCKGKVATPEYNLAVKSPKLVQEWDSKKNFPLSPCKMIPTSTKVVWWICKDGHQWRTKIYARFKGANCPYCTGTKPSSNYNLAIKYPNLVKEWHKEKNGSLTPHDITPGSKKKIWWQCDWGHEWSAPVYSRAKGHNCPLCNIRASRLEIRVYCELKNIFHEVFWKEKINKQEVDVFIPLYSLGIEINGWYWHKSEERKKADCRKQKMLNEEGITLIRIVDDRLGVTESNEIPYTNGENHFKVIARLVEYLRSNFTLNDSILEHINNYICTRRWCNEEEYELIVSTLPSPLIQNSIASKLDLMREWSYCKNSLRPTQLSYGSRTKVWWQCHKGHEWEATPNSRTRPAGSNCPYCNRKKPTPDNNLASLRPHLVKEWHPTKNGNLQPDMVLPRSNKKVWWLCKYQHEWQASIDNRFNGTNCPHCLKNKNTGKI
ncbi:zinc-ribbon domain-containing protein [Legionella sp. 31fI33]|uniref:zinc-ribbon domain-containing protein n=1 Tax=Legionella sp. 31fI33 TaxID=2886376 RepID=UPI001E448FA4|nr:zinc-ribbon domain-containing protein [Legionella sp. 31fI33]MCC5016051.1 hypothetical protein [Legionella sp. 31fI33]